MDTMKETMASAVADARRPGGDVVNGCVLLTRSVLIFVQRLFLDLVQSHAGEMKTQKDFKWERMTRFRRMKSSFYN